MFSSRGRRRETTWLIPSPLIVTPVAYSIFDDWGRGRFLPERAADK